MFFWLLTLFIAVPLIELSLLLQVGRRLGPGPTIGLVVLTGIVGAALARREGLRVLGRIQESLAQGRMPADELVDGLIILLAGGLLVTPGILTDALGFALLIPSFRRLARRALLRKFQSRVTMVTMHEPDAVDFVDVEVKQPIDEEGGRP